MDSLSSEDLLLDEILPRLPTKSVIRFKSVSKTWLSHICQESRRIAAKHNSAGEEVGTIILPHLGDRVFFLGHNESNLVELDDSYMPPDWIKKRMYLIGSSYGLICLERANFNFNLPRSLVLWNPATREVSCLPVPATSDERYTCYAFGFEARTGVHKLIALEVLDTEDDLADVNPKIMLPTRSRRPRWRDLNPIRICTYYNFLDGLTIEDDGAIYWRAENSFHSPSPITVLSFDLSKEEFREFDGPVCRLDHDVPGRSERNLVKWKGSLGAIFLKPNATESQLWSKNPDTDGWQKKSTIEISISFPLPFLGVAALFQGVFRDQIILANPEHSTDKYLYDLVSGEKRKFEFEGESGQALQNECVYRISDHIHTLISPN